MSGPELLGAVAVVALIAAAFYVLKPKRGVSPAGGYRPVSIIDAYDVAGREAAAKYIDERLGKHRAKKFAEDLGEALKPDGPPPPPLSPPNP